MVIWKFFRIILTKLILCSGGYQAKDVHGGINLCAFFEVGIEGGINTICGRAELVGGYMW